MGNFTFFFFFFLLHNPATKQCYEWCLTSSCAPPDLHAMLSGMLQPDPQQRMTLEQLLLQPWIRQPICLADYSWEGVFPYCKSHGQWRRRDPLLSILITQ